MLSSSYIFWAYFLALKLILLVLIILSSNYIFWAYYLTQIIIKSYQAIYLILLIQITHVRILL